VELAEGSDKRELPKEISALDGRGHAVDAVPILSVNQPREIPRPAVRRPAYDLAIFPWHRPRAPLGLRPLTRRILIAPDKFKGSLSANQAAMAIANGLRRIQPDATFDICPIADGGEGFMETLAKSMDGQWVVCDAVDALNRPITSRYVIAEAPSGRVAVMEMAETAGLWRLAANERDPWRTTTKGTGLQIAHAVREHNVARVILGIGGSATNDGGAGMAAALGIAFVTEAGTAIEPTPERLAQVIRLDHSKRIRLPEIIAACDVDNPLLGPSGATAVFSEQKGSTPESRPRLESALERLVSLSGGRETATTPGAGAAGGLGFGLLQFAGAKLTSGFDLLADLLDLKSRIAAADHVFTGEGALDYQSLAGKGPVGLARMAAELGVPVTGLCGMTDDAARASGLFVAIHALADAGRPTAELMANAASLLTDMAANLRPFSASNL
jgi:glycerate kinase